MGPRLIGLASLVARRQGATAARALLRAGQRWMADPANEEAKRALLEQLRVAAEVAGVAAGRISARLAREVDKRRVSVERTLSTAPPLPSIRARTRSTISALRASSPMRAM